MTISERNNKLKHFINCLKCEVSGKNCDVNCSTQYDAGNMGEIIENLEAISKALNQEPCEDCISRQAVKDTIFAECSGVKLDIDFAKVLLLQRAIKALPSVTPQTRWIPVSERLPSDGEYVIVSVLDDCGDTPWKYTTVAWLCNGVWISDNDILCGTAIAWMPLPQPYKAGGTNE